MKRILLLLITFSCCTILTAQTFYTATTEVKIRELPSYDGKVICIIPENTKVKVLPIPDNNSAYYKVEYNGKVGYVGVLFLSEDTPIPEQNKSNNCDEIKYIAGSKKPSFNTMLKGIKYIYIDKVSTHNGVAPIFNGLKRYFEALGYQVSENYNTFDVSNVCEVAYAGVSFGYDGISFYDISVKLSVCGAKVYRYKFNLHEAIKVSNTETTTTRFVNLFAGEIINKVQYYDSKYTLQPPKQLTCWNKFKIIEYFGKNSVDQFEGIYETTTAFGLAECEVALKKINNDYYLIYLSGAENTDNWIEGEIKAELRSTATQNFYKVSWIRGNKALSENFYISFEQGYMSVIDDENNKNLFLKMYPK
jgi:hypothetical protein